MSTIKLQVRRDTSANWTSINPSLLPGELGFEIDTGKLKIGRSTVQHWNDIEYINGLISHTHEISDITGLQTELDNKAVLTHTHTISNVTGLQTALDLKASSTHTHIISNITGLQTTLDAKAELVHTHSISDLTATGVKNNTTYLRGDGVWAVPTGTGGGTGSISGVLSQAVTNWTNGQEIIISHDIERNGVRLFAAYQQKSSTITDVTWNFNGTSTADWTNGKIDLTRLTTPDGQLSTTAVSTDISSVPSFPWSSITSLDVKSTDGVIKDSVLMDCTDFISEDISGFYDSASGAYVTNGLYPDANRAYISTAQAKFGTSSIRFRGTAANSNLILSNPGFAFGTGDFTIEFFVFLLSFRDYSVFFDTRSRGGSTASGGTNTYIRNDQTIQYHPNGSPTIPSGGVSLNTWHHIRFDRYNGNYAIYFNGTQIYTAANTQNMIYTIMSIGGVSDYGESFGAYSLDGYIDEFRISNISRTQGASSFTVPSSEFTTDANTLTLLHFNGTNNTTGPYTLTSRSGSLYTNHLTDNVLPAWLPNVDTNGAYYFNGDRGGSYMTFSDPIRTGDFTVEMWVYLDRSPINFSDIFLVDFRVGGINWVILIGGPDNGNNGKLSFWNGGNNFMSNSIVPVGSWCHLAIVRSSNVIHYYQDGVDQGITVANSDNINLYGAFFFGRADVAKSQYKGYAKQIRFSKSARYTGNFTPPTRTSDLTYDSNELAYYNGNNDGKRNAISFGNSRKGIINAQYGSLPKSATAMTGRATYLDNIGYPVQCDGSHSDFNLSTSDFTIETSVRVDNFRTIGVEILGKGSNSGSSGDFSMYCYGGIVKLATGGSDLVAATHPTINDNLWHHIAVTLTGNTYKLYFDGVLLATNTTSTKVGFNANNFSVGGRTDGSYPWNGQIGFVRIRKGQTIYTSAFVPPTVLPSILQATNHTVRFAISLDGRTTWKAFNGTNWNTANINDIHNTGMTPAIANAITQGQWALLFTGGISQIDLAAYLETDNAALSPYISDMTFTAVSNYWETIPMNQLTVRLMAGDTRFVQNTGGTISYGKLVVAISS